jgi:hypothetical protein
MKAGMSIRKTIGYALITSPFVAIACLAYAIGGWMVVVVPYAAAAVVITIVIAGVSLIGD